QTTTLHLLDVATGKPVRQVGAQPYPFLGQRLAIAGPHLVLGCQDGQIRLVDVLSGRELRSIGNKPPSPADPQLGGGPGGFRSFDRIPLLVLSPDGRTLAVRNVAY